MNARVLWGRAVAGCGLVAAMIAGPAALTPGTADAAGGAPAAAPDRVAAAPANDWPHRPGRWPPLGRPGSPRWWRPGT